MASARRPAGTGEAAASAAVAAVLARRLVYVTGKGGAGKSTVAAALGLAAARTGRVTLVCELAGVRLPQAFGRRAVRGEVRLATRLWSLGVDPQEALEEWLGRQPGGAVAAATLRHSTAFANFVAAAPGAKETVVMGKLTDLAGLARGSRHRYALVVADGPATGHALAMVEAPGSLAAIARAGPVSTDARAVRDTLADPRRTAYVGVSLPEEMSVRETVQLEEGLRRRVGRGLDLVVVDGLYPDRFDDRDAEALARLASRPDAAVVRASLRLHHSARTQREHVQWLRERTDAPLVALPFVFAAEIDRDGLEQLAGELLAGGVPLGAAVPRPAIVRGG